MRDIICKQQGKKDDILDECLQVCQVNGFSEATAVHFRIEDNQQEGQQGEECLKYNGAYCCDFSPYSGNESCAYDRLGQGEKHPESLC